MVGVRGVFSGVGICCCQSRQASLEVLPSFRCSIWRVLVGFEVDWGLGVLQVRGCSHLDCQSGGGGGVWCEGGVSWSWSHGISSLRLGFVIS